MLDPHAPTLSTAPPPHVFDSDPAGLRFARFVLLAEQGRGAMGVVYSAYDPELDRTVALKVLTDCPDGQCAFDEARALARLDHPNVVGVHEVGRTAGHTWMAMTFLDGPTLAEWQAGDPGTAAIIEAYTRLGDGLAAAHAAGVVHRDFKPDNVVFADDRPRIIDFGLASWRRSDGDMGIFGTPGFIAPEVLQRGPATPAADQFAFCAALYRALFDQTPYPGTSPLSQAVAMNLGRLRTPPRHDAPRWVVAAIMRGLSVDPADRWPSMAALVAELRRSPETDRTLFAAERSRLTRRTIGALVALLVVAGILADGRTPTPGEAMAWGLAWPALVAGLLWSARRWVRASPVNRALALVLGTSAALGLAFRVVAWLLEMPVLHVLPFELAAGAGLAVMAAPTLGRWMGTVAGIELFAAVLAARWPEHAAGILYVTLAVVVAVMWRHVVRPTGRGATQDWTYGGAQISPST